MRRYMYALIPIGFVILVAVMVLIGRPSGGPVAPEPQQIETDPLATSEATDVDTDVADDPDVDRSGGPTPSGPEYQDNETILEEAQE